MNRTTKAALAASALTLLGAPLLGFGLSGTETTAEAITSNQSLAASEYAVDQVHSTVLFKIRHGGLAYFYGHFDSFSGSINIDPDNIEDAKFNITVDIDSVDTNNIKRDEHVKSADFFNSRQYPKATFESTAIEQVSDGVYDLKGKFSFHGKTLPVTATLSDVSFGEQRGSDAIGFHAVFSIKRSDYGITKYVDANNPEDGGLGDTVQITVSCEAVSK
ncbi:MAG TPA: polyisoprenoid-binding protein [Phycisphaerales bacterium]|nr:polyisoprenoid-binding protein [Phycisphaerales bacterium]|tara:strand:- start:2654 stop:3307 length:654 start_codon:yes stop_codon:yes gene_type:complete